MVSPPSAEEVHKLTQKAGVHNDGERVTVATSQIDFHPATLSALPRGRPGAAIRDQNATGAKTE